MTTVSVDGNEWPTADQYQKIGPLFSPALSGRSNPATPPASDVPSESGVPNGVPSHPSDPGNPSPPNSEAARSSFGRAPDQRSKRYKQMEDILSQHYAALRRFLNATYRDSTLSTRSNRARDKLLRLSPTQFQELSTDVYDELRRRQQATPPPGRPPRADVPPFLPPRAEFHEKRNHARQKLASLQHKRFRDLATDVFYELERRFPRFAESREPPPNGYPPNAYGQQPSPRSQSRGPPGRMGRGYSESSQNSPMGFPPRQASLASINGDQGPLPKSFQSNTMVPNKSTMVEDDGDPTGLEDDYDTRSDAFALDGVLSRRGTTTTLDDAEHKILADSQSKALALQEKVDKLEELVKLKDEEALKSRREREEEALISSTERQQWNDIKTELEDKVRKAESLNSSLQLELNKARSEHDTMERNLKSQIDVATSREGGYAELEALFSDLEARHYNLQAELQEQQRVTEEVRQEATRFLTEMKALSEQSHIELDREELLTKEVSRLEEETRQWKGRYTRAKTELRHLREPSTWISEFRPNVSTFSRDNELIQEGGLVKDVHVTKFQISIDELLRIARSDEPHLVLHQVKAVVIAIRDVLHDLELTDGPDSDTKNLLRAKANVSGTANNLITASTNFGNSNGLSPVSLLDAAASHLATAVIEVIRLAKVQPSPAAELDEDDDERITDMKSVDYFSMAPSMRRLTRSSVYSAMSPPPGPSRRQISSRCRAADANGVSALPGFGEDVQSENHEIREVELCIEDQAEELVQFVHRLIASIQTDDKMTTIRTHVSAISSAAANIVSSMEHLINNPTASANSHQGSSQNLEKLDHQRRNLLDVTEEAEGASGPEELREAMNKLPPIAFGIVQEAEALVLRLNPAPSKKKESDFS